MHRHAYIYISIHTYTAQGAWFWERIGLVHPSLFSGDLRKRSDNFSSESVIDGSPMLSQKDIPAARACHTLVAVGPGCVCMYVCMYDVYMYVFVSVCVCVCVSVCEGLYIFMSI